MPWGFRQKAAFVFAPGPDGLAMGHFARGTHEVVPVVECPVHPFRANRIAFALRDELPRRGVTGASEALAGAGAPRARAHDARRARGGRAARRDARGPRSTRRSGAADGRSGPTGSR